MTQDISILANADVVIAGGGTAGCIVAARVAEARPGLEIVVVESGADIKDDERVRKPLDGMFSVYQNHDNMRYMKSKPLEQLGGRSPVVPVGNMLGGSSSINFMLYNNPAASDFDDWNQPGWSYEELKPFIRRSETFDMPSPSGGHGADGPMGVSSGGRVNPYGEAYFRAFHTVKGLPKVDDIMDFQTGHGCGYFPKLISSKDGSRSNTASAYLYRHGRGLPPNLRVITGKTIDRVIFHNGDTSGTKRAIGIEVLPTGSSVYPAPGLRQTVKARRQVVVCAGAFGSPCVLERSGIGAKERLQRLGIEVEVDLPGVGENYQDHELTICSYRVSDAADTLDDYIRGGASKAAIDAEWEKTGRGKAATNGFDYGFKIRPNEDDLKQLGPVFAEHWRKIAGNKPDKPLYSGPLVNYFMGPHERPKTGNFFSMGAFSNYPLSRGSVHITSSDPKVPPAFDSGLMADPSDLAVHVWAYKIQREVARRMPEYLGEHLPSHPTFPQNSPAALEALDAPRLFEEVQDLVYSQADDKAVEEWVKRIVGTAYHSMGTCAMLDRAEGGVVDQRLDVYGTKGLKVADLSICPYNVGCNTTTVALIVGEKAAGLVIEDLKRSQ